jgi:hypothetical protein
MDLESKIRAYLDGHTPIGINHNIERHAGALTDILLDHMQTSIDYYRAEIAYLQQQVEELDIDLMLARESFDAVPGSNYGAKLNIKRRTQFHGN